MVFVAPVGSVQYRYHKVNEKAQKTIEDAEKIRELLLADRQALWSAVRLSTNQRFGYTVGLAKPNFGQLWCPSHNTVLHGTVPQTLK